MKYESKDVTVDDKPWIKSDVNSKNAKYKITGICTCGKRFCKIPTVQNEDTWFMCPYCSAKYNSQKYGYAKLAEQRHIEQYGSIENYKKCRYKKTIQTKIAKYGDLDAAYAVRLIKTKATNMDKYGCEYSFQSELVKGKIKKTISDRYNNGLPVDNISQIPAIHEKVRNTNLEKYGTVEYLSSQDARIKTIESSRKKYNTDSPNSSDIVKRHKKTSVYEKYGVANVNKLPSVREKIYKTCLERYGKYWNVYKYLYDGIKFDSSWELIYYVWLRDTNREFTYHPAISYPYVNDAGKSSVYEPDFIIDGQLYEIKGDHFFDSDGRLINPYKKGKPLCLAKQRCMAEHNVTILRLVDLQEAFNYIDTIQLDITTFRLKGKKHDN